MPSKFEYYSELADRTATQITSSMGEWTAFLETAGRLYKYPFYEQLLIYAQRPEATACADYRIWNDNMRRFVKRGSKGIALIDTSQDPPNLKYVFDVSDTGTRESSRSPYLWEYHPQHYNDVSSALAQRYRVPEGLPFPEQLEHVASLLVNAYWDDCNSDILAILAGSFLEEYDEYNVGVAFRNAATVSLTYTVMSRCGLDTADYFDHEEFQSVFDFNTRDTVTALGSLISDCSEQILRQIEVVIKKYEREARLAQAERNEYGEHNDLHTQRRLPDPQPEPVPDGRPSSRQVWEDAESVPQGASPRVVEQPDPVREAVSPSAGDRRDGESAVGAIDAGYGSGSRGNGSDESQRPDDMGRADEHLQSAGGGNDPGGIGVQLSPIETQEQYSFFPSEAEQIQQIDEAEGITPSAFSISEEGLAHILRLGGNTTENRMKVVTEFSKDKSLDELAAFLQKSYHGGNGFLIDGGDVSAWYAEDGIHLAEGLSVRNGYSTQVISWEDAAERIVTMLNNGTFATNQEIAEAPGYERRQIAGALWYLHRDLTEEAHSAGFLSVLDELGGGGYPDETERLTAFLENPENRAQLLASYNSFLAAYLEGQSVLRFRYHRPVELGERLQELDLPRLEYHSDLIKVPAVDQFISDDEIEVALAGGSSVSDGKLRIYAFFQEQHTLIEQADFLKSEYGTGGRSHAVSGSDRSSEDHSSKGIVLKKGDCADVHMVWSNVARRIAALIQEDRYLNAAEKAQLAELERENAADDGIPTPEPQFSFPKPDTQQVEVRQEAAEQSVSEDAEELSDEQLDQLPISVVEDGRVVVYPNVAALLEHEEEQESQTTPSTSEDMDAHPAEGKHLPSDVATQAIAVPESPQPSLHNYRISDDDLGVGGPKEKLRRNMAAISTLKAIESEGRQATPAEQEILAQYVGWGGLPEAFDESKSDWAKEYEDLRSALSSDEYAAARASTLNAHYTSPTIIRAIYQTIENMGFQSGNILEPAMGTGNFFGALPESMEGSRLYGVELDSLTGRIAKQLYPKANITVAGFETTDRKDFFDLAVGNVPFGQYQVFDKDYNHLGYSIHDYFFAKTLDQVRAGGIIAFVTSRYTLDKQSPEVRKYIAQRADFLGAIRLPNNAFRANAGTDVVSDIIFLQKRDRPIEIEPSWVHLAENRDGFAINSYFVENPEMVLGRQSSKSTQYGKQDFTVEPYEDRELGELLQNAVSNIHGQYQEAELPDLGDGEAIDTSIPADPDVRNYSYTVVDGSVYYRENSRMVKPHLSASATERVKGMVALRDCVQLLIRQQMDNSVSDDTIRETQAEMNRLYDLFTEEHGLINSRANAQAFSDDSSYYLLCSLEILDDDKNLQRKADMFSKRTIMPHEVITSVDTASEALAVSISERACVDMGFMSSLTGKTEDMLADELKGVIFRLPDNSEPAHRYVTADEYLSGNVRRKLQEARFAMEVDDAFIPNVEALESVQPKDLDASEIEVRLGATWIDKSYIQEFMIETFEPPYYLRRSIEVNYVPFTNEWSIAGKSNVSYSDVNANMTFGTDRANAYRILEDTLNLRDVRIYDTVTDPDGKERRVLNSKETTLAQQKQQVIKDAFQDWIWKDPHRRHRLVAKYNQLFNSTRPREFDGSHIRFAGMNPEIQLREHQLNAVAHILYGGNTLLAHEVGAGKTFEMIAAAMESKRLGLCHKPLFAVPNHLTDQWASEFLRLYPSAHILAVTKKDFEPKNRKKFCARIATGDYDAIIMGHSQFEKIPISQQRQERLLQDQINEITVGIEALGYTRSDRVTVKAMEKTRKGLEAKLTKLQATEKKDDVITFEELGVDRLFVDEAHAHKNLFLYTKMRNVAGLSTSDAQKSSDMYAKCRYLDELTGGRGVIFATGTPVSNSMTELYTMMRYLQHDMLQRKGLSHFDCWASTFGETTTAIELAPEGTGYRARTRFAKFFNLPELMNLFKEVADIKTSDQLCLPTPKAIYHNIVTHPTEIQKEMVQELSKRAAAVHSGAVDPSTDNMLRITSDGRKLGLDQRIINPNLPDEPTSKVNICVENVFRIWREGQADKLTQLLFCDLSTPKTGAPAGREKRMDGDGVQPLESQIDELSALHSEGSRQFTIYDDIRSKLIQKGIPSEQIAYIHDANSEAKKRELFSKVRSGQVRVLMGSTSKMGAGMNVQDRLIALHDLDAPWRPGDLEQRSGRIIRQGNMNPEVHIYRYVTESTFDAYLWQTLENKQRFISQIMTSKSPVRSCEDVDETALSYAEIKALCAGDDRIREKMDLDVDVAKLKLMKSNHQSQQYKLQDNLLRYFPEQIESAKGYIAGFKKDLETLSSNPHPKDGFIGMEICGTVFTDKDSAGTALMSTFAQVKGRDAITIGCYRGFQMSLALENFGRDYVLTLKGEISHIVTLGKDARGNLIRIDNALKGMEERMANAQSNLDSLYVQMEAAKAELGKPFPQEEELRTKSARLAELNVLLNIDGQSADSHSQQAMEDRPLADSKPSVLKQLHAISLPNSGRTTPSMEESR